MHEILILKPVPGGWKQQHPGLHVKDVRQEGQQHHPYSNATIGKKVVRIVEAENKNKTTNTSNNDQTVNSNEMMKGNFCLSNTSTTHSNDNNNKDNTSGKNQPSSSSFLNHNNNNHHCPSSSSISPHHHHQQDQQQQQILPCPKQKLFKNVEAKSIWGRCAVDDIRQQQNSNNNNNKHQRHQEEEEKTVTSATSISESNLAYAQRFILLKLGDFGFALRDYEERGDAAGTPTYASPEMYSPVTHTTKGDVWSLGVILYELVTLGKPPVTGLEFAKMRISEAEKIFHREGLDDKYPPQTPKFIREIVKSCLVFDPKKRPTTRDLMKKFPEIIKYGRGYVKTYQLLRPDEPGLAELNAMFDMFDERYHHKPQ